jgi:hypothetical protein
VSPGPARSWWRGRIHRHGRRAGQPFVTENCSAIPEPLLESALFGHVRGAFTGADRPRAGLFDAASGGTLFLDEIGEMSLAMQAKLLRVLETGEIRPVGADRTRRVDVRVIAAPHRDLRRLVAEGRFREDLLYRLDVITIEVPALRERPGDVEQLAGTSSQVRGGAPRAGPARALPRSAATPGRQRAQPRTSSGSAGPLRRGVGARAPLGRGDRPRTQGGRRRRRCLRHPAPRRTPTSASSPREALGRTGGNQHPRRSCWACHGLDCRNVAAARITGSRPAGIAKRARDKVCRTAAPVLKWA